MGFSRRLGFGAVINPDDPEAAQPAPGPITYFLIDSRTPLDRMRSIIRALRRAADVNIRFAPVILLGPELDARRMRGFAAEGFDDILSLPFDTGAARTRLEGQLTRTATYFETADYMGPDRRRYSQREQTVLGSYVLYQVRRHPRSGITIRAARIAGRAHSAPPSTRLVRV